MLRNGEVNPLNVHGFREVGFCPPHFTRVNVVLRGSKKVITDWIWENLSGRFWAGDWYKSGSDTGTSLLDTKNSYEMDFCVAFEIPGEAAMFALIADQIQDTR